MLSSTLHSILLAVALLGRPLFAVDLPPYTPCPILGPRYPLPIRPSQWPSVQDALASLTDSYNELIVASGQSEFTDTTPNTTTFSVAVFAMDDGSNASPPFFYEYHHLAPSFENDTSVDSGSVYNLGGVTQVLTAYALLASAGEEVLNEPVTNYIPELSSSAFIQWSSVLLGDLATHLAGIPLDATEDTISAILPAGLASLLPRSDTSTLAAPEHEQDFLDLLRSRKPIYQPGTTPIYSNAAFELLAIALERIAGNPFAEIMRTSILEPLNISATTIGTPPSDANGIIPGNKTASGWDLSVSESALNAATGMFSTISDMSTIGQSILRSSLLAESTTNRWLKPHSYTSNPRNGVGMPFEIFAPSLSLSPSGGAPIIPIFTKLGPHGLYSPYFGIDVDHGVGFVILSADTEQAADLNAYADLLAVHLVPAMERAAAEQAAVNYASNYTSEDGTARMVLDVDGLLGISVLNWTASDGSVDVKGAYAEMYGIPPATLDLRLYPTNLQEKSASGKTLAFRAVGQDVEAPVDGGTPTCITWETSVDVLVYNGLALDEFVFELDADGGALSVSIPALDMVLSKLLYDMYENSRA